MTPSTSPTAAPNSTISLELIGIYRISVTPDAMSETVASRYPPEHFTRFERAAGERELKVEAASTVLCELGVMSPSIDFTPAAFGQPLTGRVSFGPRFLSADGRELLCDAGTHPPRRDAFRIAFFLPAYRRWLPIRTPAGLVWAPRIAAMPDRLSSMIAYRFP